MKQKNFGFVCDPLEGFDREAETSLFLMREIARRGHAIFVCGPSDLFLKNREVWGVARQITPTTDKHRFYRVLKTAPLPLKTLDVLFLRKDPPFEMGYLNHLLLLTKLECDLLMVNSPAALLKHNEKLASLDFPFAPKTLVASRLDLIQEWSESWKEGIVVKPLNEAGGRGVFWLKKLGKIEKERAILRKLTRNWRIPVIVQPFLKEVRHGDRRIMLWDGKFAGAFARKATRKGEFRANLHLGGRFERCALTKEDARILKVLGPWSRKEGLLFTGYDMIGPHLTDVNITSPMGIREVNALYGEHLERTIIGGILRKI